MRDDQGQPEHALSPGGPSGPFSRPEGEAADVSVADALFRAVLDAAPDAMVVSDPAGTIILANLQADRLLGYAPGELVGEPVEVLIPRRARERHAEHRASYAREPRLRPMGIGLDLVARRKDGTELPVEISLSPARTADGLLVISAIRDIAARRQAEQAMREQAALMDLAHDAIFVRDLATGSIRYWNRGAERTYGWPAAQAIGRVSRDLLHTSFPVPIGEVESTVRETGHWEGELIQRTRDGLEIVVASRWALQRDAAGRPTAFLEINRDVTARKRAQEELAERSAELARRTEELARSNADLEQFAYVASHDLQEPLRAVVSYLQLLERRYRGNLDQRADKYIGYAVDGARRMQALIQDLLLYSRVGRKDVAPVHTDSGAALDRALANLHDAVAESSADVVAGPLPTVFADPTQLVQLFQNLVGNAIKFRGSAPPRVRVAAAREDGAWHFVVRDNGIGIEPEYRERIFTIFQRLHTREEYEGTGIGLAVCKRIVERLGGRIWVEAEPGSGSAFHFTIPDPGESEAV